MTEFQIGIITLMKCAVTGENGQLPEGFSIEEAESFAIKQQIITLVYDGAVKCGVSPKEPAMQRMFQRYVQLMLRSERQLTEVERVFKAFDQNVIDYLPLKGCNMKQLYPKPELRYMGDADILIRVEQYDRIQRVMEELGFTKGKENNYEYHWHNSNLNVELHKSLVSSERATLYSYWGVGWDKAKCVSGTRYSLSLEDDYLFQFTHFAKHYSKSGIGCRYLLDLWVFQSAYPRLKTTYLEQELSKLNMPVFYQNIQGLLGSWFGSNRTDDKRDLMTDYLFSGNSWGSWQNSQIFAVRTARGKLHQKKITFLFSRFFPPLTTMAFLYPVLQKCPYLLPVFWAIRLVQRLFEHLTNKRKIQNIMPAVSDDMVCAQLTHMHDVGLFIDDK